MARISFQGEPGANSHIACRECRPEFEPLPCATFEDAFAALRDGNAELSMIPIENSVAGRVADIHHLMPGSGLHIIGEYFLPIHHQLVGLKGARLADLKTAQSHVHAIGQCRQSLRRLGISPLIGADTAGSAREISQQTDISRGAISSALAAEVYGLDILARDIEDEAHNTTRFIILSRETVDAPRGPNMITTFVFRVRNLPAALYKAMGGFATNGVNMTKLESYQLEGQFAASQFYADIEGHPDDLPVSRALEELRFFCADFTLMGVYEAHPYRRNIAEPQNGG